MKMMTKIYNLDNCKLSNLTYGGNAGLKLGIIFELSKAIKKIVPRIDLAKINSIIDSLPNEFDGIKVTSNVAKEFMKKGIESRYKLILYPALEKELIKEKIKRKKHSYDER